MDVNETLVKEARRTGASAVQAGFPANGELLARLANALEAASQPRSIQTADDLRSQRRGVVIMDANGVVLQRSVGWLANRPAWFAPRSMVLWLDPDVALPATVLYTPLAADEVN